jgi:hypothetical protein
MKFKVQSLTEVWKDTKLYCLGLVALLGIVVGSVFSYQTVVKPIASSFTVQKAYAAKDDEGEAVDMSYSFYDMTSWLSAYYNAASSPDGWRTIKGEVNEKEYAYHSLLTQAAVEGARNQDKTNKDKWTYADKTWVNGNSTNIGGGGALLGFPDPITLKGKILGFFASKTSSSTVDYSYDSLSSVESATYNSLETYAYYGAALDALGIDASIGSGLSGFHPIRMAAGAIVWIGYILASAAELLFKVVISILQVTNPFNWFAQGFDFAWSQAGDNGLLSGLTSMVSGMYKLFANFGWVVMIPLTVATLIFMFIFTGNGRQNSGLTKSKAAKFRYFIVYFIFLSVGVPIMGTAYTAGLNALGETFNSNNVGNGSTSVDNVIFSAYVDNKSWIENNRMYLPKDVPLVWSRKHSDVTNENKANVRKYALSINSLNHGKEIGSITDNSSSSWNINDKSSSKNKTSEGVNALLLRYMISSSYPASNWENLVKAKLTEAIKKDGSSSDKKSLVNRMSASATELSSKKGYQYLAYVNPHVQEGGSGVEIKEVEWWKLKVADYKFGEFPNIFLSKGFADNGVGGITSTTAKGANGVKEGRVELVANPYVEVSPSLVYGSKATMSYLEMFNYLNSKFYSNKVSVYSTNALASNFSRDSHAEVNQVGAGYVHKFMIWLNTVALLFGIAFLAIGYALSMLISSFKRYTNLIMSIFMGTMGMQKAMVKSASGTIMLIFEVVGTLVTYEIVKTIYMAIPDILSSAIASLNGGSKVTTTILTQIGLPVAVADLGGFVLVIFSLIVSVIILVWALLMFLRIRKPMIEMADATFTSLIAKLFYADADLGKGDDGKGGSTGMNSGVEAAGAAGASFVSNIDGADGDTNTGFVDGDNKENNEDEEETEETETGEDGDPKDDDTNPKEGDGGDEEPPRPDEREANSKDTEKLGEEVKDQKGVDRSQGKDGKQTEAKDGESGVNSESPEASQQGEDGMSAEEAAQAAEIAKANSQKPSASGSGKEGSGSGKQGSESKGVTSVSDDDTVNVEASSETSAEHESDAPKSMGTLSPEIPGEKGSGKEGASGKQGEGVKPTSESGKLEKGTKTDSPEQLVKQGAIEAAKELASHADREAQSNGASGSQKQATSGKTLEGRGSGNQSSVSPAESGKHAPQSGQEHSTSPQGAINPAESGRSSGSGSSSSPTRSQQHRQQAKVEAIGARESANQAKADAISSARDAGQGTRNVASGVGSIAAGVTAMATGDASGKAMVGQGVQQTIEGAKQLGSSISSGVSSVKNTAASVGQGVSAVTNAGASVGTAIADSKVGQATGKVASKVGSVAGVGATALGGAVLNATLEGAGMQPIARRVNGSTPASSAGTVTSTVTTTTTSGGAGGATTTTTVMSQTQAGSGGGNQQAQSSGGVLRRVGNHVENEVRQSLADMAPGTGISNGVTTSTVQRQAGSKGAQGTTVVNTTTTSSSGSQGVANQTVRVTSTGQSNGGSTPVTTTTTSNGGSNQTVQKQVTSQGGQNGTVIVNTTTTTSGQTQTVQKSVPTSGSNGGSGTVPTPKTSSGSGSGQPPVQKPTTGGGSGRGPVGDGHGYQPEQRQTPSSGGLGQTTHTITTTSSVILNRGGGSGPRNVPQSKGNILKKAGDHVESEVHKALADMGGTATSNANGEDIANDFMERMRREDLKKARKKRFNRPK